MWALGLSKNDLTLPLYSESSQKQYVNQWVWQCFNKIIYKKKQPARFDP